MDHFGATADGDGLTKHDRKHSLETKEQGDDQSDKGKSNGGDPWAKVSAYSCTTGYAGSNDSTCTPTKLPQVEIVTHDPGAPASSFTDSARQTSNDVNSSVRNGESVLKRLAVSASAPGALDAAPLGSGFQSVAQVSLRTDGIVDKGGKTIGVETVSPTGQASGSKPGTGFDSVTQTSTRAEAAQVTTAQVVDKSAVPVIKASDLVVKESTPGVKIEPSPLAATTTVARDLSSPVAPAKDTTATTTALAAKDASPVTTRVETVATVPTSSALSSRVEVASIGQSSGFQSVAQVSLRTDGIVDKSGKIIGVETVSATSQASGSKPASGFESVTQTSTRA
ncbi:MAG: hypothetical protein WC028_30720, partial [Candidatus Obscuribacterales bacterium]